MYICYGFVSAKLWFDSIDKFHFQMLQTADCAVCYCCVQHHFHEMMASEFGSHVLIAIAASAFVQFEEKKKTTLPEGYRTWYNNRNGVRMMTGSNKAFISGWTMRILQKIVKSRRYLYLLTIDVCNGHKCRSRNFNDKNSGNGYKIPDFKRTDFLSARHAYILFSWS